MKQYLKLVVLCISLCMLSFTSDAQAETEAGLSDIFCEEQCEKYFEESVEYLLDLEKGMEADVSFSLTVKDGIDLNTTPEAAVEAIVSQLEKTVFEEWENEMERADYPLIPTTISGGAYMYWYTEREQRCLNCSIQWEQNELQVRLAIMQYEPLELEWNDSPFGLTLGKSESQVEDVIDSLPYQYIEMYQGTAAECGGYVIFLPEHEELQYLQLGTDSMRSLLMVRDEIDTTIVLPFENVFTRVAYHWEEQNTDEDRMDTIAMISDTMAQTWNLDETASKDGYSWFRTIDKVMDGDPLLETELWKNKFQHVYAYDQMLIGMNLPGGHVYFEYNGGNAAAVELLKTWIK